MSDFDLTYLEQKMKNSVWQNSYNIVFLWQELVQTVEGDVDFLYRKKSNQVSSVGC